MGNVLEQQIHVDGKQTQGVWIHQARTLEWVAISFSNA